MKTTRSEAEVLSDLLALTGLPGYAHAVAAICVRDNLVIYQNALTVADMEKVNRPGFEEAVWFKLGHHSSGLIGE